MSDINVVYSLRPGAAGDDTARGDVGHRCRVWPAPWGGRRRHRPGRCRTSMSCVACALERAETTPPGAMSDINVVYGGRLGAGGDDTARGDVGHQCRIWRTPWGGRRQHHPGRCRTSMSCMACARERPEMTPPGAMSDIDVVYGGRLGAAGDDTARGDVGHQCRVWPALRWTGSRLSRQSAARSALRRGRTAAPTTPPPTLARVPVAALTRAAAPGAASAV